MAENIDLLSINCLRLLAIDMVENAKSGHPGLPLGAAPLAYVLWSRFLKHNPRDPRWPDRDRFVLSAGHGSALLYSWLCLAGYGLTRDDLRRFRQWGSRTPGHPEYGRTPGVEATTGPLGQGMAMAVGMAVAEKILAERFTTDDIRLIDHHTYAIVSDGDLMEGISAEAASLAGTLALGKLIVLYDDNHVSLEGDTALAFTEDVRARFSAHGWQTLSVADGNDIEKIAAALAAARAESTKPSLIMVRTHIGFGSPRRDSAVVHGEPLGPNGVRETKRYFGWPADKKFFIPDEVRAHFRELGRQAGRRQASWQKALARYRARYPHQAEQFAAYQSGAVPSDLARTLPSFTAGDSPLATRTATARILDQLASRVGQLVGGSADLNPSTKTELRGQGNVGFDSGGRNIHFGVREHAMAAITNGIALHGGLIPFAATFLVFSDYLRPAIRLAAMMQIRAVFVFTHDSIGLGEDGPTHQPVEQLASLRLIPGLTLIRPADANETAAAWPLALKRKKPTALILTRQNLPVLDRETFPALARGVGRGAYPLLDCPRPPQLILIATGSEVHVALAAGRVLSKRKIRVRVVSMPSWEIFREQDDAYQRSVLPPSVRKRLLIEAGVTGPWRGLVGEQGDVIGIDRFGASAPGPTVREHYGLGVRAVVAKALAMLAQPRQARKSSGGR